MENGRYRGTSSQLGYDGLWISTTGECLIVEVKTTDTYLIHLENLANYRKALVKAGKITSDKSSILIVVGRQDTGGLESQIRGSRHAWDIRVIGVEALLKLMHVVTQEIGSPDTARKALQILLPKEFTRIDYIVDLVFSTTEDAIEEVKPDDREVILRGGYG